MKPMRIVLSEWQTAGPAERPDLKGLSLEGTDGQEIKRLHQRGILSITELRQGLQVTSRSHVGRVSLRNLEIVVKPKLDGLRLMQLLRYAFGFRPLDLHLFTRQEIAQFDFEDILIHQLNQEVRELAERGLQKAYQPALERLASPRGRIDIRRIASEGGNHTATLPCLHHPRTEDTLLNQMLVTGLHLAAGMACSREVRRESKRVASFLAEKASVINLNLEVLERANSRVNRLTTSYRPALEIIRLLFEANGASVDGRGTGLRSRAFFFDMNRVFQAFVSRFLQENLENHDVEDERGLNGMVRYAAGFNPQGRKAPTPRPDFLIRKEGKTIIFLDAKYRDLWKEKLPREMLYQLVLYSLANPIRPQAAIVYPTIGAGAREARIEVQHPVSGQTMGQISLRPINLERAFELIEEDTREAIGSRRRLASTLVTGAF